eukprot:4501467-Alexandrium_andersonii.AAC.1
MEEQEGERGITTSPHMTVVHQQSHAVPSAPRMDIAWGELPIASAQDCQQAITHIQQSHSQQEHSHSLPS